MSIYEVICTTCPTGYGFVYETELEEDTHCLYCGEKIAVVKNFTAHKIDAGILNQRLYHEFGIELDKIDTFNLEKD